MRRLFARLLTRAARAFHAVVNRLLGRNARRARPAADRRARLLLAPMEGRDHTGQLAGGLALAALGYTLADPLQGMALAVGDLALLAAAPAAPGGTALPTIGDPPQPLTRWLPADPNALPLAPAGDGESGGGGAIDGPAGEPLGAAPDPLDQFWLSPEGGWAGLGWAEPPVPPGAPDGPAPGAPDPAGGSSGQGIGAADGGSGGEPGLFPAGGGPGAGSSGGQGGEGQTAAGGPAPDEATEPVPGAPEPSDAGGAGQPSSFDAPDNGGSPSGTPGAPESETAVEAVDWVASESGRTTGVFRISRAGDTAAPVTVRYLLSGTAVNGTDYDALPGQVTIPAGAASVPVLVTPVDDAQFEGPEAVTLTLYGPSGALRTDLTATVSINDDDDLGGAGAAGGAVRLGVVALADAAETDPAAVFAVTRSGGDLTQPLAVTYTLGGTAVPGTDYTAPAGSVTFGANQTAAAVRIAPVDGPAERATRTVTLGGLAAVGAPFQVAGAGIAVVSLTDRSNPADAPRAAVIGVAASAPTAEAGVGEFTFTRAGADLSRPLEVGLVLTGAAGAGPTRVRFAPYAATATVFVSAAAAGDGGPQTVVAALVPDPTAGVVVAPAAGQAAAATVFAVRLVAEGSDAGATHTSTVALAPGARTPGGALLVTADTAAGAAAAALSGRVDVSFMGQSATYAYSPAAVADAPTAHDRPFLLDQPDAARPTLWRVGLEDLQAANMQGLGVDWDYNDRVWTLDVREYAAGTGTGLLARYFGAQDLTALALVRVDPQVDNDWGAGAPDPALGTDHFSVRWTGRVQAPYTGDYVFKTVSDDGVRLWVNGSLAIDNWTDHGPTADASPPVRLVAGQQYDLKMEYYESAGGARAQLLWASDAAPEEVIPTSQLYPEVAPTPVTGAGSGLLGRYFDGQGLTDQKVARVDPRVGFDWGGGSPDPAVPADHFSARWTGQVQAAYSGAYTFYTASDDGVRLWVNGQPVVDNWTDHGPTEDRGTVSLVAGQKYDLTMEYYESAGGARAQLLWSSDDQLKEVIPSAYLYPTAVVTVGPAEQTLAEGGTGAVWVSRSGGDPTKPLTVNLSIGADGANPLAAWGTDYALAGPTGGSGTVVSLGSGGGTVTFGPNVTRIELGVSAERDELGEGVEAFRVSVAEGTGLYLAGNPGGGTSSGSGGNGSTADVRITDRPVVRVERVADAVEPSAGDPGAVGRFRVSRSGPTAGDLDVSLSVGGTATPNEDYTPLPATVRIPAGSSSVEVDVTALPDELAEPAELVTIAVAAAPAYEIGAPGETAVRILDEPTLVAQAVDPVSSEYQNSTARFRVVRLGDNAAPVAVPLSVSGDAAPAGDYGALPGGVEVPAGAHAAGLTVTPVADSVAEPTEHVLLAPAAVGGHFVVAAPAHVLIRDRNQWVTVEGRADAAENGGAGSFRFVRSGAADVIAAEPLTVRFDVTGTATAGADYTALSGEVVFAPGQTEYVLPVTALDDLVFDPDETVTVTVSPRLAAFDVTDPQSATVTIADDDPRPVVEIEATADAREAGHVPGTFVVRRSGNLHGALRVPLVADGTATSGTDFSPLAPDVLLPDGVSSVTVTVAPIDDDEAEPPESLTVELGDGSLWVVAGEAASIRVINDDVTGADDTAETAAETPVAIEVLANDPGAIRVTSVTDPDEGEGAVEIVANGARVLYTPPAGWIGSTTFQYTATAEDGATTTQAVTVTVRPGVEVEVVRAGEEQGAVAGQVRFRRLGGTTGELTVPYTLSGTATQGADYTAPSGQVVFPDGTAEVVVDVPVVDDAVADAGEYVKFTITPAPEPDPAYLLTYNSRAFLNIKDNDVVAADDTATTQPGTPVEVPVLDNDTGAAWVTAVTQPAHGSVTIVDGPHGSAVEYTSEEGWFGNDTFEYTVENGDGVSASAHVTVSVLPTVTITATGPVALEPVGLVPAIPGSFTLTRTGNAATLSAALTVPVLVTGTATHFGAGADYTELVCGGPITQSMSGLGRVTFAAGSATATLVIWPLADATAEGPETVTISVLDEDPQAPWSTENPRAFEPGEDADATVTIYEFSSNRSPVALPDRVLAADQPRLYGVLANDTDPDGDALTIVAVEQPQVGGTVAIANNGQSVNFTPAAGATGQTTFRYQASDGRGGLTWGTVTVDFVTPELFTPPVITSVGVDSTQTTEYQPNAQVRQAQATDRLSNAAGSVTVTGTARPNQIVVVYRNNAPAGGTVQASQATADASGNWSFIVSGQLAEGVHQFQATGTDAVSAGSQSTVTGSSRSSNVYKFTVDRTAPRVVVADLSSEFDRLPVLQITVTDENGAVPNGSRVKVAVSGVGDFWGVLSNGQARVQITQPLPVNAPTAVTVSAEDEAGNRASSTTNVTIRAQTAWTYEFIPPTRDPFTNVQQQVPFDLDNSPGLAASGGLGLVYNSDTVNPRPAFQLVVTAPNTGTADLPANFKAQLDLDLDGDGRFRDFPEVTYKVLSVADLIPQAENRKEYGQTFTITLFSPEAITQTRALLYAVEFSRQNGTANSLPQFGPSVFVEPPTTLPVVVNTGSSRVGAGWSIAVPQIVPVAPKVLQPEGAILVTPQGEGKWFAKVRQDAQYDYYTPGNDVDQPDTARAVEWYVLKRDRSTGAWIYTPTFPVTPISSYFTEYRFDALGRSTEIADLRQANRVRIQYPTNQLMTVTAEDGTYSQFYFVDGSPSADLLLDHVGINGSTIYGLQYYETPLPYRTLKAITGRDGTVTGFTYQKYTQSNVSGPATTRPLLSAVNSPSELLTNPYLSAQDAARLSPGSGYYVMGFRYSTGVSNGLAAVSTVGASGAVSTTTVRPAVENQQYQIEARLGRPVTQTTDPRGFTTTYVTRDLYPQYNPYPLDYHPRIGAPRDPRQRRYSETRVFFPDGSVAVTHYDAQVGEIILAADPASGRVYRSRVEVISSRLAPYGVTSRKVVTFDVTDLPDPYGSLAALSEYGPQVVQVQELRFSTASMEHEVRQPNGDHVLQVFPLSGLRTGNSYLSGDLVVSSWGPRGLGPVIVPVTQFTYRYTNGLLDSVLDKNNRNILTKYFYYPDGRLWTVWNVAQGGRVQRYFYDTNGNVSQVRDDLSSDPAYGPVQQIWSDASGRPLKVIERGGATTYYVYDKSGKLRYTIDPLGALSRRSYSSDGRLAATREQVGTPMELATAYRYDASGNLLATVVGSRYFTQTLYDGMNRPVQTRDGEIVNGQAVSYRSTQTTYLPGGRVESERDPLGRVTRFSYAQDARTLTTTAEQIIVSQQTSQPEAYRTVTVTDQAGNVVEVRNPSGLVERHWYGPGGQQWVDEVASDTSVPAAQQIATTRTVNEYDSQGRPKAVTETVTPVGATAAISTLRTEYEYQSDQIAGVSARVIAKTGVGTPDVQTTTTEYDMTGAVSRQVDARGVTTTYRYLPNQNAVEVTEAGVNGPRVQTTYADLLGRTVRVVDADQKEVTTDYNDDSGTVTVRRNDGEGWYTESTTRSDVFGRTTAVFDANQNPTVYGYDGLGRRSSESTLLGQTRYGYDVADNLRVAIDALGRVRTFSYDDLNRPTGERWLAQTPSAQLTDGSDSPLADVYSVAYSYDATGLRGVTDSAGTALAYTYDAAGRTLTDSSSTPGNGGPVVTQWTNQYDLPAGSGAPGAVRKDRSELRLKGPQDTAPALDHAVEVGTDALGRTRSIVQTVGADQRQVVLNYAADWSSTTMTRRVNGGAALTTTDTFKALAASPARPLESIAYSFGGQTLEQYTYQYNADGSISGVAAASGDSMGYGYDAADRLTAVSHSQPPRDESFDGYDHAGNRLGEGVVIGSDNRLMEDAQFTYQYDAVGNLITKTDKSSGEVTHYEWDYRNRLTAVWTETAGQVITSYVQYQYDALDRRVSRTDTLAGTQSVFVWHGDNVEAVLDGQGKVQQRFLHGTGTDEVLAVESFAQPASAGTVGNLQWTLLDHINTVRGLLSTDGTGLTALQYDAYGRPLQPNAVPLFGFAGREWDATTRMYSNRARWLDPTSGRFISQDPIGLDGGLNRYAYALSDPIANTDPSGKIAPVLVWGAYFLGSIIVGATIGAGVGAVLGGINGGVEASLTGGRFWRGFREGAIDGAKQGALIGGLLGALPVGGQVVAGKVLLGLGLALTTVNTGIAIAGGNTPLALWRAGFGLVTLGVGYRGIKKLQYTYDKGNKVLVTSWAAEGIKPDLEAGRWVMLGGATWKNYLMTGLWFLNVEKFILRWPYIKLTPPKMSLRGPFVRFTPPKLSVRGPVFVKFAPAPPFTNAITGFVPKGAVKFPRLSEVYKLLVGQRELQLSFPRIYRPEA